MAKRIYSVHEGDRPYTELDIKEMTGEEQVRIMVSWFFERYEDPANRLPYNTREGGYQWVFGSPTSADEALQDEFSSFVDYDTIQRAVEEIEADGFDWSPIPDDDYYEEDEPNAQDELLALLAELRSELEARRRPPGLGHNRPPEAIDDEPLEVVEVENSISATDEIASFAQGEKSEKPLVRKALDVIGAAAKKIAVWLGHRATNGVDAFVKGAAAASGAGVIISWEKIGSLMQKVIELAGSLF